ncbi:MAG: CPBP family intramembrane metalloprotease [Puniceicoccales bacterium]|jgi:membrane protease YdiL (CAAX protease family)|nr:CPBP family intramembrane metalloprotease [Puniceicoccales bacterium]
MAETLIGLGYVLLLMTVFSNLFRTPFEIGKNRCPLPAIRISQASVFIALISFALYTFLGHLSFKLHESVFHVEVDEMTKRLVCGTVTYICVLALVIFIIKKESLTEFLIQDFDHLTNKIFSAIGCGLVGFFVMAPLVVISMKLTTLLIESVTHRSIAQEIGSQYLVRHYSDINSIFKKCLSWINLILLAPMVEEIVFRFLLYRFLRWRMVPWAAMLISSMVFSSMHDGPRALFPLFIMGLSLVFIYDRFGNILVPMVTHALFNAFSIIFLIPSITTDNFNGI